MAAEQQPNGTSVLNTTPINTSKRRRPNNESPDSRPAEVLSKPIDICGHCNKKCMDEGPLSEAIQCDFCGYWLHVLCESLTKEHYESLTQLTMLVDGLTYYCKLKSCATKLKSVLSDHLQMSFQSHCKQLGDQMTGLSTIELMI